MTRAKKTKAWFLDRLDVKRRRARRQQGLDGGKEPLNDFWKWYWAGREFSYEDAMRLLSNAGTGKRLHIQQGGK